MKDLGHWTPVITSSIMSLPQVLWKMRVFEKTTVYLFPGSISICSSESVRQLQKLLSPPLCPLAEHEDCWAHVWTLAQPLPSFPCRCQFPSNTGFLWRWNKILSLKHIEEGLAQSRSLKVVFLLSCFPFRKDGRWLIILSSSVLCTICHITLMFLQLEAECIFLCHWCGAWLCDLLWPLGY